jgi:hypothetical protein
MKNYASLLPLSMMIVKCKSRMKPGNCKEYINANEKCASLLPLSMVVLRGKSRMKPGNCKEYINERMYQCKKRINAKNVSMQRMYQCKGRHFKLSHPSLRGRSPK